MKHQTFELEVDGVIIATNHTYGYIMQIAAQLDHGKTWAVFTRIAAKFPSKAYKPRGWYDEADKVAEMRARGVKWADIAERMDMNVNTVIAKFQKHKQYRKTVRGRVDQKAVLKMVKDGIPAEKIAQLLHIHPATVYRTRKRAKLVRARVV